MKTSLTRSVRYQIVIVRGLIWDFGERQLETGSIVGDNIKDSSLN